MKKTFLLIALLALFLSLTLSWAMHTAFSASYHQSISNPALVTQGNWTSHPYDLLYTVTFSTAQQPIGPLVVYRAATANLAAATPVIALRRSPSPITPLAIPSPNGHFLALATPLSNNVASSSLSLLPTDGSRPISLLTQGVASNDTIVWSADSNFLYYHTVTPSIQESSTSQSMHKGCLNMAHNGCPMLMNQALLPAYDEIHRIDVYGHDTVLLRRVQDGSSLRIVGIDRMGELLVTLARPQQPLTLLRIMTQNVQGTLHPSFVFPPAPPLTLPADILPGNVLGMSSDGNAIICERVLNWQPLRYTLIQISLSNGDITPATQTDFTPQIVAALSSTQQISVAPDSQMRASIQVTAMRNDLAVQGLHSVPAQEILTLWDQQHHATQRLTLPPGGQIVSVFWTSPLPMSQWHIVPQSVLAALLAFHQRLNGADGRNALPTQQDEWMLEAHAGLLSDTPGLPTMCYGTCPQGANGAPHVSAAILHGIAYVESNWHQFNTSDYDVGNEPVGTPVESFDGGWGEFQQTWGMPPQCQAINNCRSDATRIENDQQYNIGTGTQALIHAWNGTAGVSSSSDPNDPYKANDWFFAVWAYNGSYGNNPNDVPSSVYGHWYPGAPFRSIYEEYVWYFAAHPQNSSNGWTDAYLPSLGTNLLPPQADFTNTSDSFVACVTCTIPDWTAGSYDRDWVGTGAPNTQVQNAFTTTFTQAGGENIVGLPRDNGGSAAVHRWGTGWTQDFGGGLYLPGALMLPDGGNTAYWVYGGVWTTYLLLDSGADGCHGYPTSALVPYYPTSGGDSYFRQSFQSGTITWDATTHAVVADSCQ